MQKEEHASRKPTTNAAGMENQSLKYQKDTCNKWKGTKDTYQGWLLTRVVTAQEQERAEETRKNKTKNDQNICQKAIPGGSL